MIEAMHYVIPTDTRNMSSVSVLQQIYDNQQKSIAEQLKKQQEGRFWQGTCRYCFIGMLIGILFGSIPFATILTLYIKNFGKDICFHLESNVTAI